MERKKEALPSQLDSKKTNKDSQPILANERGLTARMVEPAQPRARHPQSPGLLYFSLSSSHQAASCQPQPSRPEPKNPFSCLDSLRALEKNISHPISSHIQASHQADWSSGLNRLTNPHPSIQLSPSLQAFEDEQLCWKGPKLIWSKGSSIYRTLDFSNYQLHHSSPARQIVHQALFALFDPPNSNSNAIPDQPVLNGPLDHHFSLHDHLPNSQPRSPQLHSFPSSSNPIPPQPWSDNRSTQRNALLPRSESSSPVRGLCVLLSDVFKIYLETGEEYSLAVPFQIQRIWPIERGVMLMKKPTSLRPRPFIPSTDSLPLNQVKTKAKSRKNILADRRWPPTTQPPSTSDWMLFDSMATENETRFWSSLVGFDFDDRDLPDHEAVQADDGEPDDGDLSADLARYWAERKQIESSMLWTLSDPCTHYIQPVLTTEQLILPSPPAAADQSYLPSARSIHQSTLSDQKPVPKRFCKAVTPLTPLVTPPRRPGCSLASGTVAYVADPIMNPLHPICITASTEGFTVFLRGRLPPYVSDASSGLIQPSEAPINNPPEPEPCAPPGPTTNPPRSPTPPSQPPQEPQLRRSPRKLVAAQRNLTFEPLKSTRQGPKLSSDNLSPTYPRSNRQPSRLGGLGHPSLRRNYPHHSSGASAASVSIKKRGINTGSTSSVVGARRMSVVSNSSNASFNFGPTSGPPTGGSGLRKPSGRKSLAEQQLEMMSGGGIGSRIASGTEKLGAIGLDRESGGGFDEWFDGMMDSEPSDRRIDGQLADEALDPEFVIQTLETVEVPGRLTAEELPLIHAALYDSRGPTAHLAVCIPTKSKVYSFRLTRTSDSILIKSIGKPLEGTSIGPVLCTRPKVYDLFKFSNATGQLEILSADSICLHKLQHPDSNRSPQRSVRAAVGSCVEFISARSAVQPQQGTSLINLRADLRIWPLDGLVPQVFQVLSEEIGIAQLSHLFQRYIGLDSTLRDPMKSLDTVLVEALSGDSTLLADVPRSKSVDQPIDEEALFAEMANQVDELRLDPALSGLISLHQLKSRTGSKPAAQPTPKPPSSPRKRAGKHQQGGSRAQTVHQLSPDLAKKAMVGLGRLYADLRCTVSSSAEHKKLGKLLLKSSSLLGWIDWTDKLRRSLSSSLEGPLTCYAASGFKIEEPLMPDLCDHLNRISLGLSSPYSQVFEATKPSNPASQPAGMGFYGGEESCRRSKQISTLYRLLFNPSAEPFEAAKSVLAQIDRFGWTQDDLDDLWFGIAVPLKEALRYCQFRAPHGLSIRCYKLMGRPDLCVLADQSDHGDQDEARPSHTGLQSRPTFHVTTLPPPSIQQLCAAAMPVEHPVIPPTEHDLNFLEENSSNLSVAARFSDDMRIIEAAKMLNYTQEIKVRMHDSIAEMTSADLVRQYSSFFAGIAKRTMSLPFGGACFWYKTDANVAASVPMIKLDIRILPSGPVIQPDLGKLEPLSWPRFHAGVAAGLSLSVEPDAFDSSQISLGRPDELDDRHAGYLLGLGLNQHLRSINRVQIFRYLETKHEMTSVGVLLGLSAAFIGTGDGRVSSIIAAHVPAMHPTESVQLQVSALTQSAGFISFGLLHLGTANRRLSDGMLRDLSRTCRVLTDTPDGCRESYTLCAGLGYGLVMLGKGTASDTPAHKDLMRTFKSLIHGDGAHPLPGLNQPTSTIDVSVTSPAATIALALLYLKTGRAEAAMLCDIPQTLARLEYIRPALLMVRTLAKGLIMWQAIEPEMVWLEGFVPKVVLEAIASAARVKKKVPSDLEAAYWAVVSGAALALALKYAGSASGAVHGFLLGLYDRLLKVVSKPVMSVQARVQRHCLRSCHNVLTLGLAIVMAGTGELELLRRLRVAHGQTNEATSYGTHLARHLALGLLFLGGGRHTLSTSDRAVASLVCALYPVFPSRTDDQVHHLQPLRHLWALAVEQRCLVARDVDRRGELVFLPIKLKIQENEQGEQAGAGAGAGMGTGAGTRALRTKLLTAPTLVPEMAQIQSVRVESPRYWPLVLDLAANARQREYFARSLTVWVKRKVGHLSYSQDPKGTKSIASRGRGAEEARACETEGFGRPAGAMRRAMGAHGGREGWHALVEGFDLDAQAVGLASYLCTAPGTRMGAGGGGGALADYTAAALLQCLLEDKPDILATYLALYGCVAGRGSPDRFWQVASLASFYGDQATGEGPGAALVDKTLLSQVEREAREKLIEWGASGAGMGAIMRYMKSDGEEWEEGLEGALGEWLGLLKAPLPSALRGLRKFVRSQVGQAAGLSREGAGAGAGSGELEGALKGWLGRKVKRKMDDQLMEMVIKSCLVENR